MTAHLSAAIVGTNYDQARSFEVAFTAVSTTETALALGSYEFVASADCYVRVGAAGLGAAVALPSTQPALGSPNRLFRCVAGVPRAIDISAAAQFIRVIRASADGTLTIHGPLGYSANP